jgi:predicted transposase/invertase (TIGR01784 family)
VITLNKPFISPTEDIEMIGSKDPYIAGAVAAHRRYSLPRELREIFEARKKANIDKFAELGQARYEGREEGKVESAARMKADGMEAALIAKYTGLSIERIREL